MKLSDAIIAGCKIAPVTTNQLFDFDTSGRFRCCAVGAAYVAYYGIDQVATEYAAFTKIDGKDVFEAPYPRLRNAFPELWTYTMWYRHPVWDRNREDKKVNSKHFITWIIDLADTKRLSRERIAREIANKGY